MATDERPFGFWTAAALVVGGMIGSGIFLLPSQLAPYGWTGLVTWIVGGAGAIVLGYVLVAMTAARPESPSVLAICGDVLGPMASVLLSWGYWASVWSANAVIALTAARYLASFIPQLGASPMRLALGGVAILAAIVTLNLRGMRTAGRFQMATTALKVLPLLAVVVIVTGLALEGGARFRMEPHAPFALGQLTPAMTLAFFALVGFESASLAAGRVRDPARNVVRATMLGLALTAALYCIVCTGIVFAMPQAILVAAPAPMALFVATFWGNWAGLAVSAFTVIAAVGCLNGWVFMAGQVPLGIVRAGLLPGWVAPVNRHDVPVSLIVFSSLLSAGLMLASATRDGAAVLDFMLRLTAASSLWTYAGACVAALMMKVQRPLAALGLVFSLWFIAGSGLEAGGLSFALMLTALPLYWLTLRDRRRAAQPA